MSAQGNVQVFLGSTRSGFAELVERLFKDYPSYSMHYFKDIDTALDFNDNHPDFTAGLAIIDGQDGTNLSSDWCQSVRMLHPQCPIILLYSSQVPVDFATVTKNGADVILNIVYDAEFIVDTALALAPAEINNSQLRRVHLTPIDNRDLTSEMDINFDVFVHLPTNKKTILLRREGDSVDDQCLANFEKHKKSLYIKKTDLKKFYEYTRTKTTLEDRGDEHSGSPTEYYANLKGQLRNLNQTILNPREMDFAQGKQLFEQYNEFIKNSGFLTPKSNLQILEDVQRLSGRNLSFYDNSLTLAHLAGLFSQLLGWSPEKVHNLSLAGLFHNIGLANLPSSITGKDLADYTLEESNAYFMYPEYSITLVKTKKIPLPTDTTTAILEHREYLDGSGFPHKTEKAFLSESGRLLALAYRFMELVSQSDNSLSASPQRAIDLIQKEALSGQGRFDLVMSTTLANKWNSALKKTAS